MRQTGAAVLRVPRPPRRLAEVARAVAWFVAPFVALGLVWTAVIEVYDVPLRVFPAPTDVAGALRQQAASGALGNHIWQSLRRVFVGGTLAILTSVPLGVAVSTNRVVAAFFAPILRFFSVLAGIAWIPLATLWFGYGFGAITFIIFNAVFFVVVYNTMLGVSRIPLALRNAARSLGAGPWQILTEVLLPGALPNIVTGIRTGMGFAWRGLIAAEIIATNAGLGYMLFLARDFYRTEVIVLGMILIGAIWVALDRLVLAPLERRTIERWGLTRRVT
ncbi:MAG: ABC transporter permease [Armatimonadota bacterium]|nr:ABC transporter permease [Armatimonadota bacterium]MDR7452689.1 ABC transporter permease [Armatimonadota bacterium]MDR7466705.1 ABC transporter permease [Armatimonadota bacterium]MDR7492821.1 ABC transporter permease [Armatimonadota bacterium]MDR7498597.1 ABC transporter permease [Armatimonadota bacterium]